MLDSFWLIGPCMYALGRMARLRGDLEDADTMLTETLAMCREVGHKVGLPLTLAALGNVSLDKGEFVRSATFFRECLEYLRDIGQHWGATGRLKGLAGVAVAPWGVPTCLEGIAGLAGERGEYVRAARLLGRVTALRDTSGYRQEPVDRPPFESRLAMMRSAAGEAAFDAALAEGQLLSLDAAMDDAFALVDVMVHEDEQEFSHVTPFYRVG
jgi:hypothetical protein